VVGLGSALTPVSPSGCPRVPLPREPENQTSNGTYWGAQRERSPRSDGLIGQDALKDSRHPHHRQEVGDMSTAMLRHDAARPAENTLRLDGPLGRGPRRTSVRSAKLPTASNYSMGVCW